VQAKMQEVTGGLASARPESCLSDLSLSRPSAGRGDRWGAITCHEQESAGSEIERLIALLRGCRTRPPLSAQGGADAAQRRLTCCSRWRRHSRRGRKIVECPSCGNLDTIAPCTICQDPRRDAR